MIDAGQLGRALGEAIRDTSIATMDRVALLAKDKAPVRKIFGGGRRRTTGSSAPVTRAGQKYDLTHIVRPAFEYRNHSARRVIEGNTRTLAFMNQPRAIVPTPRAESGRETGGERKIRTAKEKIGGTGKGRPNSYHPVVSVPGVGRIMGDFRQLSAPGKLAAHNVYARVNGKTVKVDLTEHLTSHAKYDLRTGRGVTAKGEFGGTLRDSIEREGPFVEDGQIVTYVKAAAFSGKGFNYALAQEIGTAHNRPQPYLRPALRQSVSELLRDLANDAGKAFRVSGRVDVQPLVHLSLTVDSDDVIRLQGLMDTITPAGWRQE